MISQYPSKKSSASLKSRTGKTSNPPVIAASRAFSTGTSNPFKPAFLASTAIDIAPRTGRTVPSKANSPRMRYCDNLSGEIEPLIAAIMPIAIGKSNAEPSFRISAGAKFTVIRLVGNVRPAFLIAAITRSRLSFTALSGKPTTENEGSRREISASICTIYASIPSVAQLNTRAVIKTSLPERNQLKEAIESGKERARTT